MYAHAAILEALLQRERTGSGSAIHVSLFDAMSDWMTVPLLHYEYAGMIWPRVGLSHPTIAPYGAFPVGGALGNQDTVLIGVQNDGEWKRFAHDVLKRPELLERQNFATNLARVEHRAQLDQEIAKTLSTKTKEEVIAALKASRIAFASVNDVTQLSSHPQLRRATVPTAHGEANLVAPPAIFRGQERKLGNVPGLGQHSVAIRDEFAKS
jgi:crotonobetainyl-CoA:carnitine CoA-transferase CaiB-like acyl-CoA transferase